jgi:probable HAF family extracellular repeat protein
MAQARVAAAFAGALLLIATGPARAGNSFQGIGAIAPSPLPFGSTAYAASSTGSTAAGYSSVDLFEVEAVRWIGGSLISLGLAGDGWSYASAATPDLSVIVGARDILSDPVSLSRAFRWQGGVALDLGDYAGGDFYSQALDVSDSGAVVVGYGTNAAGTSAFRWQGLGLVPLGSLPGGTGVSRANAVSADGLVIAGTEVVSTPSSHNEAFRWQGGVMTPIGDLPGGSLFSEGYGISADGSTVVGRSSSSSGSQAYRWKAASLIGLGDLPGGSFFSRATGANADGSIVVGSGTTALGDEAFIWDAGRGMRNLREVMIEEYGLGAELAGWRLYAVNQISADGRVLAGSGIDPLGFNQGWVAVLDAPVIPVPALGPGGWLVLCALLAAPGCRLASSCTKRR